MAWIESHQSLRQHPKTRRLSKHLGVSLPTTIGHLHCLWWWSLDYAPDGNLADIESDTIAAASEWAGDSSLLINALKDSGFLDDTMLIHDWNDYAGRLIGIRQKRAERMRQYRAATLPSRDNHVAATLSERDVLPYPTVPNQTNRTEPTKSTNSLSTAELKAWPEWYAMLWSVPGFKRPLEECADWLASKKYPESGALAKAYALRDWWPASSKSKKRTDPWLTFTNWMVRDFGVSNHAKPASSLEDPQHALIVQEKKEMEERAEARRKSVQEKHTHKIPQELA